MLTSNHNLLANICHIKSQIHPNIRDIAEKMVQEVRYISPSLNIAEGLTRTIETKEALQRLVQTGQYHIPGGFSVFRTLQSPFNQPTNFSNTKQLQKEQATTGTEESWRGNKTIRECRFTSKQAHIRTSNFRKHRGGRQRKGRQCRKRRSHHWWISQYEGEKRRR